jgi:hypothetical protein
MVRFKRRRTPLLGQGRRVIIEPMALKEFLAERKQRAHTPGERTGAYAAAVSRLIARFKAILSPFKNQLTLEEWLPLLKEVDHGAPPYNAPALTVIFDDDQITIEPVGYYVINSKGRVQVTCGVREVHLDWAGSGDDWAYRWVNPRTTNASPLTDAAVEEIVQGMLA